MHERAESSTSSCSSSSGRATANSASNSKGGTEAGGGVIYLENFQVSVDGDWLCLKEKMVLTDEDNGEAETASTSTRRSSFPTTPEFEQIVHPKGKRTPVDIEKSNLINILQLVIKEVIDSSLKFGRQLDSDHVPLQHFFIVIEHILRHGFQPKKSLIGAKKELWDLLQQVERRRSEAVDITASVRDLPTVKTATGRARAWLRLAVMQKRLGDYLSALIANTDALKDFYETSALLRSEEDSAHVVGLVTSLNVVDCNICVKEEDLDSGQGVIDFSMYLKMGRGGSQTPTSDVGSSIPASASAPNIAAVLDQKSYVEELNRTLTATVTNLESKVEGLATTNALMKEDLSISRREMLRKQEENNRLQLELQRARKR